MEGNPARQILIRLASGDREQAWSEFLELYSPLILQVVNHFETEEDRTGECFLFVCDQLSTNGCRRLRRFEPAGPAKFSTWLRVVARNLCLDWRRKEIGRPRVFRSVARLGVLDQQVFDSVYQRGMSQRETLLSLQGSYPKLTEEQVSDSVQRVRENLTSRQLWLLGRRRPRVQSLERDSAAEGGVVATQIADPGPNPETLAEIGEQRSALTNALSRLEKEERLLLRLRYEEGLTLDQVARFTGLGNAQRADRRIKEILTRLREEMS
jgi:DNA-directed RNA polymerase specialized sigma24 family protein